MYRCEDWTIKKAEHQRIDAFKLWFWRILLREPWTARRSNQSILKEINPEYSLEGLLLKLKPQYLVTWCKQLIHWKRPWCWERLKAKGERGNRGWDGWMASPIHSTWVWASSSTWWRIGKPGLLQSMGSQRIGHHWVTEKQQEIARINRQVWVNNNPVYRKGDLRSHHRFKRLTDLLDSYGKGTDNW